MKTIKMLAVTPYKGLGDFFTNCAKSFPGICLDVFTGNLQAAAQNLERYQGYDIVVSRGGTAQMLREKLPIPVIEVEVSVYDMLRVIKMAQQTGKNFAIMGFANMIKTSRIICEILRYDVPTYTINSEEDAERVIRTLKKNGIELVVGDVVTTDLAGQTGLPSLLITSGAESVEQSFVDAVRLFQNLEKLKRVSLHQDVLDASPHQVAVFDGHKRLSYANPAFRTHAAGEPELLLLRKLIPLLEAKRDLRLHRRLGGSVLSITGVRLGEEADSSSYAFYVTSAAKARKHENCVRIENPELGRPQAATPTFLDAERVRATLKKALEGDKRQSPVIILGQAGTGVEALARHIHDAGAFKSSLFITVDCRNLSEKHWHNLVNHDHSPIHDLKCTIFFQGVHWLGSGVQRLLNDYMEDTLLAKRHHVLSSSSADLTSLVAANEFLPALYQKLNGLSVVLPSLSERPEEIPALASLFINRYNREFTKQIVGFEDDALEYLKAYPWELNLEQLQDVVRQLVIQEEKSYITLADVQKNLSAAQNISAEPPGLNLNKTLEEIEKDIISNVLAEEGMNQSRAAKRLGIGRSTLWRKMAQAPGV